MLKYPISKILTIIVGAGIAVTIFLVAVYDQHWSSEIELSSNKEAICQLRHVSQFVSQRVISRDAASTNQSIPDVRLVPIQDGCSSSLRLESGKLLDSTGAEIIASLISSEFIKIERIKFEGEVFRELVRNAVFVRLSDGEILLEIKHKQKE